MGSAADLFSADIVQNIAVLWKEEVYGAFSKVRDATTILYQGLAVPQSAHVIEHPQVEVQVHCTSSNRN